VIVDGNHINIILYYGISYTRYSWDNTFRIKYLYKYRTIHNFDSGHYQYDNLLKHVMRIRNITFFTLGFQQSNKQLTLQIIYYVTFFFMTIILTFIIL